jgi:hypothetical protein
MLCEPTMILFHAKILNFILNSLEIQTLKMEYPYKNCLNAIKRVFSLNYWNSKMTIGLCTISSNMFKGTIFFV